MKDPCSYDTYPPGTVMVANLVTILICLTGAYLMYRAGLLLLVPWLLLVFFLEFRLIRGHCVDCYYYGKTCAFGNGRISALFFPRGDPERFSRMTITWKDLVPDFLVTLIPVITGIALLLMEFSWSILLAVLALLILGFPGNAYVRGTLACRFCRQREAGCPAERLFAAKKP